MRRFSLLILILGASGALGAANDPAASWPRWRGERFDGTASPGSGLFDAPFELRVRWKRTLGAGYSGVVVADGHAVTMFSDGSTDFLVSLASATGDEQWRVPLAPAFPGRDGSTGGPVSTPAIDGGVAYALGPRGHLVAVKLADGTLLWKKQIVEELGASTPHWGFTTSPLVTGNLVIVLTGGAPERAITAFDTRTGAVAWRRGSDVASYQSPMLTSIGGVERLVVGGDQYLLALDPRDGREVWRYEHGGRGFYGQIINPVAVGDNQLLLTYRPDESVLLRTAPAPEVAWTTRDLKLNYSTPIAHDGKVFGYSGAFLSCIDARTGALIWRSRPPGDGFPIVVDGHLVVLTKQGSLAVSTATAKGFAPQTMLELFSRLVWTPPSFAEGRIFARDSYSEIAAVDIVPLSITTAAAPAAAAAGTTPGSRFARWVADVGRASNAAAFAREFLAAQKTFPIIEDERYVHFVYEGPEADVVLRGDALEVGRDLPLGRIPGTDLHYASIELAPDARISYQFVRNLGEAIVDPKNPAQGASLNFAGSMSMLYMPRADRAVPAPAGKNLRGRIVELELETDSVSAEHLKWGGKRPVHVYLPPDYDASQAKRYATVYVLYGEEMRRDGHLDAALDREIGVTLQPVIAVFVHSTNAYEYARTFREAHRRMLVERVVPMIDARFRTLPEAAHRTLVGADEAGFAAIETGLLHSGVFGRLAAQSIYPLSAGGAELLALVDRTPPSGQRIQVDWGRYDPRRQSDLLDVPGFTRTVRDRLAARGHQVGGREWPDGSAVPFWSARAISALRSLQEDKR